ncbi:uncharacterized protein DS421_5g152760 [Arachis hypogaea]|nr:uncharacterized protein DS421_5g152760 [Arachis hypogaea]
MHRDRDSQNRTRRRERSFSIFDLGGDLGDLRRSTTLGLRVRLRLLIIIGAQHDLPINNDLVLVEQGKIEVGARTSI